MNPCGERASLSRGKECSTWKAAILGPWNASSMALQSALNYATKSEQIATKLAKYETEMIFLGRVSGIFRYFWIIMMHFEVKVATKIDKPQRIR